MSTPATSVPAAVRHGRATPLRFVSAASLFDGHDAAINIIRRLLQAHGAEVIHLGHNRSVAEVVRAALQEDADAIACSSYQGGHMEYFKYMVDMLRAQRAEHIRVVVGGGGTIAPHEVAELEAYGVEKIYSASDGLRLGLKGMIEDVFERVHAWAKPLFEPVRAGDHDPLPLARTISMLEASVDDGTRIAGLRKTWQQAAGPTPVVGITGTGGSGKSSLIDELLNRLLRHFPGRRIAMVAIDPTRRRTGGALLGDRIRLNSLADEHIFMRSIATRRQHLATSAVLADTVLLLKYVGFDLIFVETAGIGQSDTEIVDLADLSLYVMTSEYGAASQLEKIDMLDYANLVALNKFEKRGALDALRDVRKQWKRNHQAFKVADEQVPVYPTIASRFNDPGVNRLFAALCREIEGVNANQAGRWPASDSSPVAAEARQAIVPAARVRYLADIAEAGRATAREIERASVSASLAHGCHRALEALADPALPALLAPAPTDRIEDAALARVRQCYNDALADIGPEGVDLLREWPPRAAAVQADEYRYEVRGREIRGENYSPTLSHLRIPKIAVPRYRDWGDLLRFLMEENLPGAYPYTAGVYPYRREQEDPTRQFAGEGTPERTNRRFHYLAFGQPATRLSTAFDSTTLYGEDPDERPDIYGRIGNSGVSVASLNDMKKLYSGFDLCDPKTSVSMTINGPAPMLLAMFLDTAIDQKVERYLREHGELEAAERRIAEMYRDRPRPAYAGELPRGHDGFGLALLGASGDQLIERELYLKLAAAALSEVRGTVQADILKEDQAQNTCIFSTEFALRMMGDVQAHFIAHGVRNFYSVSVSGYHIAEAGANPISQLAFTLANGFTIVEYYLSRGMDIDGFAPNLSFFFSNGMDPEYAVIGRVARRIWARAMREVYGAGPRSQMLKYHVQTSGRSLHAQEIQFNDIHTTLQALYALFDSCNSLHTNAYDEAITTPTEESVRRAMAIQLIINKELGLNRNQNPWQGSFVIEELTRLVEEAVYQEFERIAERGGVLGAMESMYQRGRIQDESLYYESMKHDGTLPIVGVNTFKGHGDSAALHTAELIRSTEEEKQQQVAATRALRAHDPEQAQAALRALQNAARANGNTFAELLQAVKVCSLGQITHALYDVGGRYRRNM